MSTSTTLSSMSRETCEIPQALERLVRESGEEMRAAGAALRALDPSVIVTIARGTSDHAAGFLKYAIELQTGVPVASLGPSLASIYGRTLKLKGAAALGISQSGKSPDIVALAEMARASGALSIALVNTMPSPLADACERAIALHAGPEKAIAATKSFFNSIAAGLFILAEWTGDAALSQALERLPEQAEAALALDWSPLSDRLGTASSLYVLGRGPSLAIAGEAALKCKETCELHAEAYSSAEVLHGPVSLVAERFPVLLFCARDEARDAVQDIARRLALKSSEVFINADGVGSAHALPRVEGAHPLTDALLQIIPYYRMVELLSRERNLDPDAPAALQKVTETL
ncbi:SIS domain-containing protein [Roseibium aestuarii]|uniref:SIS domain-containing protein n=1 Tax=Roseibium aestuarii TaxID=2600299 RepID=A0ABW4K3Q4_9HYPH|nr:SIS domain-containing protein [Roseibium aestuarii]